MPRQVKVFRQVESLHYCEIIVKTALDFCFLGAPRDLLREAEADPHSAPTWTGLPIALLPSPTPLGRLDPQVQTGRVTGAVASPVFKGQSWNGLGLLTRGPPLVGFEVLGHRRHHPGSIPFLGFGV